MDPEDLLSKCGSLTPSRCQICDKIIDDFLFYVECRIISAVDKYAFIVRVLGLQWGD